jgi:adenine-specific DNA-methyltransferase
MPTLDWIGKQAVVNHHREVPYRLIHCDSALSAGDAEAGNLLVQGDNLEALRALLPYYAGRVKCIYIDPPYNTGNEGWVYNDNVNSPEMRAWLGQVVGKEAEDLSRHDKWLCMMYPRLRLLREFLREDGTIWITLDDTEIHLARIVLDEIFGSKCFLTSICWQSRKSKQNDAVFSLSHNTIVSYSRVTGKASIAALEADSEKFDNKDNDPRGAWVADPFDAPNLRPNLTYEIVNPQTGEAHLPPVGRCWRTTKDQYEILFSQGRIVFGKTGRSRPQAKRFLSEAMDKGQRPSTWWDDCGTATEATQELQHLFDGRSPFDTPKPVRLIERILRLSTLGNDLILDSFAGSGTTGHAVLDLNKQDGGNRKFILVEMDPAISQTVTAERLRRVIAGYDKGGDKAKPVAGLGGGFRFCQLGVPLFDEYGDIAEAVTFPDLAAHIFFSETGVPIPARAQSELLGLHQNRAVYLLFDAGHAGAAREAAGNVLTPDRLASLPGTPTGFDCTRVVYAEGCTVSGDRLKAADVTFKQIPYQVEGV